MLREVINPNPVLDRSELELFARRYNLNLPRSYEEFLLKNNGGRPVPSAFPIYGFEENPEDKVNAFFGLRAKIKGEDLEENLKDLEGVVPKGILLIAYTPCNDNLVLDLRKPQAPILFWDRKPFWGNNVWNEGDLYPVAKNFESLLDELHDSPYL